MLEVGPGVYTSPRMNRAVRERVWEVLVSWHDATRQGSVLMTWPDRDKPGGQVVVTLGMPQKSLIDHDGVVLAFRPLVVDGGGVE